MKQKQSRKGGSSRSATQREGQAPARRPLPMVGPAAPRASATTSSSKKRPQTSTATRAKMASPRADRRPAATRKATTTRKTTSFAKARRRRIKWGRLAVVCGLAVALGYGASYMVRSGGALVYARVRADIVQLTEHATPLPYSNTAYQALSSSIRSYLSTVHGTYSVSGRDLVTDAQYGVNGQALYSSAQTEALPVAIDLYSQIAAGITRPQAIVSLTAADDQAGQSYIGGMPYGSQFTVTQLARAAIVNGDVVALNMLVRYLGTDQINQFLQTMGSTSTLTQPYVTSTNDLSSALMYLYNMDQSHSAVVAPLMKMLQDVPAEHRIAAGIAPGTRMIHITGDWPNEFHDAAILWTAGHPVTLAICSDNVTAAQAAVVEAHIAALVNRFAIQGTES